MFQLEFIRHGNHAKKNPPNLPKSSRFQMGKPELQGSTSQVEPGRLDYSIAASIPSHNATRARNAPSAPASACRHRSGTSPQSDRTSRDAIGP